MRIAYLCSDPGVPIWGSKGASIHVRALSRSMQRLGHEVTVLSSGTGGRRPAGYDLPVVQVEPDPLDERLLTLLRPDPGAGEAVARDVRSILSAVSLRHRALPLLRSHEPDLVYERYALFGTAGIAVARELGVPLILEVNAPLSEEQERHRGLAFGAAARELEGIVLRSADRIIAVSSALAAWLTGAGVAQERVTVLPNAVDPRAFDPMSGNGNAVRSRLGLADTPVVGFLGTLKPWHDVPTLVRSMGLLRRRTPAAHLLVVGEGPERGPLEELGRTEGIAEAATFVGAVPHEEVPAYVGAFDVAVVPYGDAPTFYFSPLKLFEYLAAGRPVVAADIGDIRHCVRHGVTGLLYPPGDAAALAGAIEELLGDRARAASLGSSGREHVLAHHTWEGNARRVTDIAQELVGRPSEEVPA